MKRDNTFVRMSSSTYVKKKEPSFVKQITNLRSQIRQSEQGRISGALAPTSKLDGFDHEESSEDSLKSEEISDRDSDENETSNVPVIQEVERSKSKYA